MLTSGTLTIIGPSDDEAAASLAGAAGKGGVHPAKDVLGAGGHVGAQGQDVRGRVIDIHLRAADEALDAEAIELRGTERSDGILVKGTLELRQILGFTIRHITAEGLNPTGNPARLRGQIQVPDFRIDKVEGEWLIPTDGALLVSLGVRPGKKNILGFGTSPSEHLFLIKARRITEAEIAGAKLPAGFRPNAN